MEVLCCWAGSHFVHPTWNHSVAARSVSPDACNGERSTSPLGPLHPNDDLGCVCSVPNVLPNLPRDPELSRIRSWPVVSVRCSEIVVALSTTRRVYVLNRYILSDFRTKCDKDDEMYRAYFPFAVIAAITIPISVPVALWYMLHYHRKYRVEQTRGYGWPQRLKYMQVSYKEEYWW